jgi:hypothetical protein
LLLLVQAGLVMAEEEGLGPVRRSAFLSSASMAGGSLVFTMSAAKW